MQDYFFSLTEHLTARLTGEEVLLANYSGEESDFVRFNTSAVRQAGSVTQHYMDIELIDGARHTSGTVTLTGSSDVDTPSLEAELDALRANLPHLPEDPYLLYATDAVDTEQVGDDALPPADAAVDAVLAAGKGRDLVGIYAAGRIAAGFANSLGQRNWFTSHSFHMDWCFYHQADKAVKTSYAGFAWDEEAFAAKVTGAVDQLEILARPAKTIEPGGYRVFLAPAAMEEIASMLCWGGFGLKQHRTKNTPLLKMIAGEESMAPAVTLCENTREGLAPNFSSAGFIRPDAVMLIEGGQYKDCLVSPRSAKEYDVPTTGASAWEHPASLDMAAGQILADDVLPQLETGVYVNTLWYLNYSDRPAGRITGMTRFATFWVEDGQIAAPLNVMRFDETVYRILGENLLGLTARRDFLPSSQTYGRRHNDSARLPGALIEDFQFTL